MNFRQIFVYGLAFLLGVLILIKSTRVSAQIARYDRPSLTVFYADCNRAQDPEAYRLFCKIPPEDKFYYNNVGFNKLNLRDRTVEGVAKALYAADAPKKSLAYWFNRDARGNMNANLIAERGEFNAIDADIVAGQASKRGNVDVREYGYNLLKETYFVVFDYGDMKYEEVKPKEGNKTPTRTWSTVLYAHVFKIDYTEALQEQIYEAWISEDEVLSPEERDARNKLFDQIEVPLVHVKTITESVTAGNVSINPMLYLKRSMMNKQELFAELVESGYAESFYEMEKSIESFVVKVGITDTDPIRAKIGRKEGLRIDQRYDVLEYEQASDSQLVAKRKGIIRASAQVVDNRTVATGQSEASQFYQIAGGRLEPGMTLKQRNDFGISVMAGYQLVAQQGVKLRYEQMLNKFFPTRLQALFAYIEVDLGASTEKVQIDSRSYTLGTTDFRFSIGLGKGFQLMRNLSILPNIAYTGEGVSFDTPENSSYTYSVSSSGFKAGADLVFNLYYPIQGVVGAYGFAYSSPDVTLNDNQTTWGEGKSYGDIFLDRSAAGVSLFFGIKANF